MLPCPPYMQLSLGVLVDLKTLLVSPLGEAAVGFGHKRGRHINARVGRMGEHITSQEPLHERHPRATGCDSPAEGRGFEPSVSPRINDALGTALFASAAPPIPPERPTRFGERDRQFEPPSPADASFLTS
jgi:hypothetical protein